VKRSEIILENLKKIFVKKEKDDNSMKKSKRLILSIAIAVIVWFVIINIVNPSITVWRKVTDINFIGENELRNNGLVVVSKEDMPDLNVKIKGTRNDLMNDMNRIFADINLTNITGPGTARVYPLINMPADIMLEKQKNSFVELQVEYAYSKEIPVRIVQMNEDKLKNKMVKSEGEFDTIRITGSKSDIEKAEKCIVNVDTSELSGSGYGIYSCEIVDADNSPIRENNTIYMEHTNMQIKNTVYNKKQVNVKAVVSKELEEKYIVDIDEESYSRSKIEIGVVPGISTPSVIEAVLENEEITNGVAKFKIQIPDGMYVRDEYITADVKMKEREEITETLAIEVADVPEDLVAENLHIVQTMTLSVPKGYDKNIKAKVDASDGVAGENTFSIEFDNENIKVVGNGEITVVLKNK